MAIQTNVIGEFGNGTCVCEYDYDDATGLIQLVRIRNGSEQTMSFQATRNSDGRSSPPLVAQPGQTVTQNVPQNVANQLKVVQAGPNKFVGVSFLMLFPAP
jgi:hypothetical protein